MDVGVGGSGYTVIEAARAGRPAIGCDLSLEGLLDRATSSPRPRASRNGRSGSAARPSSSRSRPARSARRSRSPSSSTFPTTRAALRELARVLRPGGRAWVTVPHALQHVSPVFRRANRRHDRRLGHLRRYEAEKLIEAAEDVGLEPVEVQFTGHAIKVLQLVARPARRQVLVVVRAPRPQAPDRAPREHAAERCLRACVAYWQGIVRRLDRPGRRGLLVVPGSIWVSATYREPCLVYWRDGTWIHHYREREDSARDARPRRAARRAHGRSTRAVSLRVHAPAGRHGLRHRRWDRRRGAAVLASCRRSGRVVSAEAHPRTFERLAQLCDVNKLSNVTALQVAVSDSDGTLTISDSGNHLRNTVLDAGANGIEVPARRIDTHCRRARDLAHRPAEDEHRGCRAACTAGNGRSARLRRSTSASVATTSSPTAAGRTSCGQRTLSCASSPRLVSRSRSATTHPSRGRATPSTESILAVARGGIHPDTANRD